MTEHTPTPWDWMIHDHSMASLGVMPDPGLGDPLVLAIAPCQACADRAEPREWKWGRCHTPSEADANFILTAVNNHDALMKALEEIAAMDFCGIRSDDLGRAARIASDAIRAAVGEAPKP